MGSQWGSQGSPPLPRGSGTPSHGIPWAPKGSLSHGSPPMGSLWAPKGPLPWRPTPSHSDSHPCIPIVQRVDKIHLPDKNTTTKREHNYSRGARPQQSRRRELLLDSLVPVLQWRPQLVRSVSLEYNKREWVSKQIHPPL